MFSPIRPISALLSVAALIFVAACTSPPAPPETLPDAVVDMWAKAFNAHNAEALAQVYSEDCILMPPGAKALQGRRGVLAFFHDLPRQGMQIAVTNEESEVRGDMAVRRGTYEMKDRDGSTVERGKYLEVWRKQDGQWLLSRDIWNADEKPQITPPSFVR